MTKRKSKVKARKPVAKPPVDLADVKQFNQRDLIRHGDFQAELARHAAKTETRDTVLKDRIAAFMTQIRALGPHPVAGVMTLTIENARTIAAELQRLGY